MYAFEYDTKPFAKKMKCQVKNQNAVNLSNFLSFVNLIDPQLLPKLLTVSFIGLYKSIFFKEGISYSGTDNQLSWPHFADLYFSYGLPQQFKSVSCKTIYCFPEIDKYIFVIISILTMQSDQCCHSALLFCFLEDLRDDVFVLVC